MKKNFKRIFSLLIIICMMPFCAVHSKTNDRSEGFPVVVFDTFNDEAGNINLNGWSFTNQTPMQIADVWSNFQDKSEVSTDKCLKSTSRKANTKASRAFSPLGGKVVISYKLRIENNPKGQIKLPEIMGNVSGGSQILTSISANKKSDFNFALSIPSSTTRKAGSLPLKSWCEIEVEIDTDEDLFYVYADGKTVVGGLPFYQNVDADDVSSISFFPVVADEVDFAIDDFKVCGSPAKVVPKAGVRDTKFNSNVSFSISKHIKKEHPRIFISDFSVIDKKIKDDSILQGWYNNVKESANSIMTLPPRPYGETITNNAILEHARAFEDVVYILSLVYQIEKDKKYLDRLYKEIENTASYPSWQPSSFLSVAEMSLGYSIAYDWNYYDWTDEQRKFILDTLLDKGLTYGVDIYNGIKHGGTSFISVTHNWNLVCNASLMISGIAIADEYPNIADLLLDKGSNSIQNGLTPYNPIGGYPEGAMYWAYGTNFLTYIMAALDTSFEDGFDFPAKYKLSEAPGISITPEFPIYMAGNVGSFNFGDSSLMKQGSPIMMWFATKFDKPEYQWYYLKLHQELSNMPKYVSTRSDVLGIVWYDQAENKIEKGFPLDKAYQNPTGVNSVLLRSSWQDPNGIYLGMKGGFNKENHQGLAAGTFVLDALGERWATMRGPGTYTWPNYNDLSGGKFKYYICRAEGQNTLSINPSDDFDQEILAQAVVTDFKSNSDGSFGIVDLTPIYGTRAKDVKRGIKLFDNRTKTLIQDEIEPNGDADIWWFMHTPAQAQFSEDGRSAVLTLNGKRMFIRILEAPLDAKFSIMDAKPLPLSPSPIVQLSTYGNKLAINTKVNKKTKIVVEMIPLQNGEAIPMDTTVVTDLKDWKCGEEAKPKASEKLGENVVLSVDSPFAFGKGAKSLIDQLNENTTPVIINSKTFVPIRFIAEKMGGSVTFSNSIATIIYNDITHTIDLQNKTLDQKAIDIEVINDRTMIPIRQVAEMLGLKVTWNEKGFIFVGKEDINIDDELIKYLDKLLNTKIIADGNLITFFEPDVYSYNIIGEKVDAIAKLESKKTVEGNKTIIEFPDGTRYEFSHNKDEFENIIPPAFNALNIKIDGASEAGDTKNWLKISGVLASGGYENSNIPENTIDNDIKTRWSANGEQWISYDFGAETNIHSIALATYEFATRSYNFDVEKSTDGQNWETVKTDLKTSLESGFPTIFNIGDIKARYIKLKCSGYGEAKTGWNSYTEFRAYVSQEQEDADKELWNSYFVDKTTFSVGDSFKVITKGIGKDGKEIKFNPENDRIEILSSDSTVAVVGDKGQVTVIGEGEARITALVRSGSAIRLASILIVVGGSNED